MAQGYLVNLGDGSLDTGDAISGSPATFDIFGAAIGAGAWTWSGVWSGDGNTYNNVNDTGVYYNDAAGNVWFIPDNFFMSSGTASATAVPPYDPPVNGTDGDDTMGLGYTDAQGDQITATGDTIMSGDGNDSVDASGGDDTVWAGTGDDTIAGGEGDDSLFGEAGDDSIDGGAGADTIRGDTAQDGGSRTAFRWSDLPDPDDASTIDDGDALISGSTVTVSGIDVTYNYTADPDGTSDGAGGSDTAPLFNTDPTRNAGIDGADTTNGNSSALFGGDFATSQIELAFGTAVENVSFRINDIDSSANFNDNATVLAYDADGNAIPVTLTAGFGLTASDTDGVAGDDTVSGTGSSYSGTSTQASVLVNIPGPVARIVVRYSDDLGAGDDGLIEVTDVWFDAPDALPGDDSIAGGAGDDTILGEAGDDTIDGGADADLIYGGDGADSLRGGTGSDTISGDAGDDSIAGGDGVDTIHGEAGSDSIDGGAGADIIYGDSELDPERVVFEWSAIPDPDNGGLIDDNDSLAAGASQNVAGVGVTYSYTANPAGSTDGSGGSDTAPRFDDATTYQDGIDTGRDPANANSNLQFGGDLATSQIALDFDQTVQNVAFRINDIDFASGAFRDNATVRAYDALGNPIVVNITFGTGLTPSDTDGVAGNDTGTSNGISTDGADPAASMLVEIPGPVARIEIVYEDSGQSGDDGLIQVTDVWFDAPAGIGGDDRIEGGTGEDSIFGETGNDTITGGGNDDRLFGGDGNDSIDGGTGRDTLYGGAGDDILREGSTGGAQGTLYGGDGNDTLYTGTGGADDVLFGDAGNDILIDQGTSGSDDSLHGGAGDDDVRGGAGNDSVYGGDGADTLQGGAGDDVIDGGDQGDTIFGGDGNDIIDSGEEASIGDDDTVFGGAGNDTITESEADAGSEDVFHGDAGNDTLSSNTGTDTLYGGADSDTLIVSDTSGDDRIEGGEAGDDYDVLDASGVTTDTAVLFGANEAGTASHGGGTANFSEIEEVRTGAGDDSVDGSATSSGFAADTGAGDDTLTGGAGDETLVAGTGSDTVEGGGGDDTIVLGSDGEADTIVLADGFGNDTITGFDAPVPNGDHTFTGTDVFDVTALTDAGGQLVNTYDVTVTDDGSGNAVLSFPNGESVTLVGIAPAVVDDPYALNAMGIPLPDGTVSGTSGDDLIDGTYVDPNDGDRVDADDAIIPGDAANDDLIEAGAGDDNVLAGVGDDTVLAGSGNDTVAGEAGEDTLYGEAGDDVLSGGIGADSIDGGAGDDSVTFSDGDSVQGGAGDDTFTYADLDEATNGTITIDGGAGDETPGVGDTLDLGFGADWSTLNAVDDGTGSFSGSVTMDDGTVLNFSEIENIICFTPGTRIATPHGARAIETMRVGDLVVTRDHGLQPIRWIDSRTVPATGRFAPVRIGKGVCTGLERDLLVSPQHRMLFQGYRAELLFGESEVLAAAKHLIDGHAVRQEEGGLVTYVHMMFDQHEIVFAEGAATESFHPGDLAVTAISDPAREELFAIFPELRSQLGAYGQTARRCLKRHETELLQV